MLQTLKLTIVNYNDKKKDGTQCVDKNGKKYTKVSIKGDATGDTWLSTIAYPERDTQLMGLKVGDEVTVLVEKKGDFTNFSLPTKSDKKLIELETRVAKLEGVVFNSSDEVSAGL